MSEIVVNMGNLEKSGLPVLEYVVLQMIFEKVELPTHDVHVSYCLSCLEQDLYIKRLEDGILMRQKGLNIFATPEEKTVTFEAFWEAYHTLSGLPKTDREAAQKYWNGLRQKERRLAYEKMGIYLENNPKYRKKARTYLKDKNFNDDYATSNQDIDFTINA
jgi:hypothetical protein